MCIKNSLSAQFSSVQISSKTPINSKVENTDAVDAINQREDPEIKQKWEATKTVAHSISPKLSGGRDQNKNSEQPETTNQREDPEIQQKKEAAKTAGNSLSPKTSGGSDKNKDSLSNDGVISYGQIGTVAA